MMLTIGLCNISCEVLKNVPFIPNFFRSFITKACWTLSKAFSESIDMMMCFVLDSVCMLYYVYWFVKVVPTLHPMK
jgi:hypothetical protein